MSVPAIIIWTFLLGSVLFLFIKGKVDQKKYKGVDMAIDAQWMENSLEKYPKDNEVHQYYFHHDKEFFHQGHQMEDRDHNLVYEAKVLYNNLVSANEVDFINHIIDYKHHHKIGKTVTSDFGTDVGTGRISATTKSTFKFDGTDVYRYLEDKGYTYQFNITGLAYWIDIKKDGNKVATLYSSNNGKNFFNATGPIVPKMGGTGLLVVESDYPNLDAAFLYAIAFARTELSTENMRKK